MSAQYTMAEDGNNAWETIQADSLDDAKKQLHDWARDSDWNMDEWDATTIQVDYALYAGKWEPGDDAEPAYEYRHTFHPDEPACIDTNTEHDWTSSVKTEGGLKENPGVFGHGGGVIIHDHCRHCGVQRTQDTWAQDPTTGSVLDCTAVSYARAADDFEREASD